MGGSNRSRTWLGTVLGIAACFALSACSGGGSDGAAGPAGPGGPAGPPGPPAPTPPLPVEIGPLDPLPGVNVVITGVTDNTGGTLAAGDLVTVRFTAKTDAGVDLDVTKVGGAQIYLSGPTENYQRVLLPQSDVATRAVNEGGGVWAYTFVAPIPSVYPAPVNDTASFGLVDGELQGTALLPGTYTAGLQMYFYYDVNEVATRDAGSQVSDLLFGAATSISPREVVANANCNVCHDEVRAHGGSRVDVKLCLLCHTSGSEDKNVGTVAGGTPGVTVDFGVMIHQIHNAKHLPSVLGVGTLATGLRNYAATPKPLQYVGYQNALIDLSSIGWPVMPSAYVAYIFDTSGTVYQRADGNGPMPKDLGYGALTASQKYQEDRIRSGAVQCAACHGDPDGAGAAVAPAQGHLFKDNPSRKACGSCHDDLDYTRPYTANGVTMPANLGDSTCINCHAASAPGSFPTVESHLHPYSNPALNTGINLHVLGVSGGTGTAGRHQLGDPVTVAFDVKNDAGADIPLYQTTRGQAIVIGPTTNPQALSANVNLFDSGFRKSSPFTGAGTITGLTIGGTASDRVYAVVFTAVNTFDVVTYDRAGAAFATLLSAQVVPAGGSLPVALTGLSFTVNDTGTDFAAGDRFYMEVIPTASSYTKSLPFDVALEDLGAVPGGFPTTLTVANTPLIWGRQVVAEAAPTANIGNLSTSTPIFGRIATVDMAVMSGLARRDYVVLDYGLATEEIVRIGRIQTTDDKTSADLGANDRLHFATTTRFAHAAGSTIQEVTLTNRREGVDYTIATPSSGQILLAAGGWASTANRVVVSYRTDLRFGRKRFPGDTLQDASLDAPADTDDVDQSWGDWKGLPYLHGTYSVGFWINRDYTASGNIPAVPSGESTGYRMINPPSTQDFLYGAGAGALAPRAIIADGAACNTCHGDIVAHGNGRRGLATCLMCHAVPGFEDGPRFTIGSGTNPDFDAYAPSFVSASPGLTMDFRQLLHKVHMGKELANASQYKVVGVFLGLPYGVTYEEAGFPDFVGGVADCARCHGATDAWKVPAPRVHPLATAPTRAWRAVCGACHDSSAATAHIDTQTTAQGAESCDLCHGPGKAEDVVKVHFPR